MAFDQRYMYPLGCVVMNGWRLKRYGLTVDGSPISTKILSAVEAYVTTLLPSKLAHPAVSQDQESTPKCAVSVLHVGKDANWLSVYAWCYQAIAHCRAASALASDPTRFSELPEPLIGCVWELMALMHERSAWVRHVMEPDDPDVDAYLADFLPSGFIGRP